MEREIISVAQSMRTGLKKNLNLNSVVNHFAFVVAKSRGGKTLNN